jgi:hypothetical protein
VAWGFFLVLVGIVIPIFFLASNFSFLGIYRRILGHIYDEIWVMGHDNGFRSCRDQWEFP